MKSRTPLPSSQTSMYAAFARRLRAAIGLGSAAGILVSIGACGGRVVIDQPNENGEGGSSSVSGTTSSSSGTPTFECDISTPPEYSQVYQCIPLGSPGNCPDKAAPEVIQQLSGVLNTSVCEEFCCTQTSVTSVPCGPDPTTEECCYIALMLQSTLCEGRPFIIDGAARTADIAERADWNAPIEALGRPDCNELEEAARRELAEAWGRDALAEHASIASFARFVMELCAVGAPADLVRDAQRAMGDEIRHAELCFALASTYAARPVGPGRLAIDGALVDRNDPAVIAAAVVREGCVGETIAALVAAASRDAAEDPAVRGALAIIAPDEEAHAALAWRYVAWALATGDERVRQAINVAFTASIAEFLGQAAPPPDVSAAAPPPDAPFAAAPFADASFAAASSADMPAAALRAHGRLSDAEQRGVIERALAEVIQPCARGLLSAYALSPAVVARNISPNCARAVP